MIKYIPETSVVDLKGVLQDVKRSLINEMDFLKESQNGEQFYQKNNEMFQFFGYLVSVLLLLVHGIENSLYTYQN